jgi:hypothetical protein
MTSRLLASKTLAAPLRHELLYFKAESHLRLDSSEPAAKTYDEAAEIAPDEGLGATDVATALLIRRSKRNMYRCRFTDGSPGETYSIIEDDSRKHALRALYADEKAASAKALQTAAAGDDLPVLWSSLQTAGTLRKLEIACTGGDAESKVTCKSLAERAEEIMKEKLKDMTDRVEKLQKDANKKKKMGSAYRKRGLAEQEKQQLRRDIEDCTALAQAARKLADAGPAVANSDDFAGIAGDANALARLAEEVLTADYSQIYDRN